MRDLRSASITAGAAVRFARNDARYGAPGTIRRKGGVFSSCRARYPK